ncbi:casparian strip membrane protein 3-like [Cucurbita pepo subsp. pepo]|uniref:casparian strip membrane protein 3-like n=1 Tax=Cucurbita pepo subsp. pepo TaxID=3664 RepID=UPI000C9D91F7|nr:casparian strip membrane protein 3-like [Cucurbita pepo subsp. pepo]
MEMDQSKAKPEGEVPLGSKIRYPFGGGGAQRGLPIVDLVLRVVALMGTLCSAIVMGTANQTLPFSTQSTQFKAVYKDLPMFMFFVLANSVACAYLFISLPLSIFQMVKVASVTPRLTLLIFDTMAMALVTAGASVAASVVYLAYQGNNVVNWASFCSQFNSFCRRSSQSLIGSFGAVLVLVLLITLSAIAMSRRIMNIQPYNL